MEEKKNRLQLFIGSKRKRRNFPRFFSSFSAYTIVSFGLDDPNQPVFNDATRRTRRNEFAYYNDDRVPDWTTLEKLAQSSSNTGDFEPFFFQGESIVEATIEINSGGRWRYIVLNLGE